MGVTKDWSKANPYFWPQDGQYHATPNQTPKDVAAAAGKAAGGKGETAAKLKAGQAAYTKSLTDQTAASKAKDDQAYKDYLASESARLAPGIAARDRARYRRPGANEGWKAGSQDWRKPRAKATPVASTSPAPVPVGTAPAPVTFPPTPIYTERGAPPSVGVRPGSPGYVPPAPAVITPNPEPVITPAVEPTATVTPWEPAPVPQWAQWGKGGRGKLRPGQSVVVGDDPTRRGKENRELVTNLGGKTVDVKPLGKASRAPVDENLSRRPSGHATFKDTGRGPRPLSQPALKSRASHPLTKSQFSNSKPKKGK